MAEAMRAEGLKHTPLAQISRAKAGFRGETLIVNLPGSLKAIEEMFPVILPALPHALEKIKGDPGDCGRRIPHSSSRDTHISHMGPAPKNAAAPFAAAKMSLGLPDIERDKGLKPGDFLGTQPFQRLVATDTAA